MGGYHPVFGFTVLTVHVGAAVLALPLLVVHVWGRRQRPRRADMTRRTVLRAGALGAGSLAVYTVIDAGTGALGLPGQHRRATGSYERGSGEPDRMPVTQWFTDTVPTVERESWRLTVGTLAASAARSALPSSAPPPTHASGPRLHRRVVRRAGVAGNADGPPRHHHPRGVAEHRRDFRDRIPQTVPSGRSRPAAAGHSRRRPAVVRRPRRSGSPGRPRPPWLLVGQVGGASRANVPALVAAAAVPLQSALTPERTEGGRGSRCHRSRQPTRVLARSPRPVGCPRSGVRWPRGRTPGSFRECAR